MAPPAKQAITDEQAERIDAFLGDGTYDTWSVLDWEAQTQLNRAKKIDNALWNLDHKLAALSPYGTDWVAKLKNDLDWGMDLIKGQKFPDPAQFQPLLKMLPVALDTADLKMKDAEVIPTIWLVSGAVAVPVLGFASSAAQLRNDLLELEKLLTQAQFEQIEGEIKAALGIVLTTVGLMLPGLGLLAKGGMGLAEVLLAGPTTTAGGTKYAKFAAESVAAVEKAGEKVRHVAERGGKVLAITGFYFDIQEVRHVRGNVEKIQRLLDKTRKEYDKFKGKLKEAVTVYQRVQHMLEANAEPIRRAIDDKTRERDDLIRQYAYSIVKPVAWRIVDDYSRFTR